MGGQLSEVVDICLGHIRGHSDEMYFDKRALVHDRIKMGTLGKQTVQNKSPKMRSLIKEM